MTTEFINCQYLYYSLKDRAFFDPLAALLPLNWITIVKRESTVIRLQVVTNTGGLNTYPAIPTEWEPSESSSSEESGNEKVVPYAANLKYALDISNQNNVIFGIKTRTQYTSQGDFTQAFTSTDPTDPWHYPSYGRISIPVGIVGSISAGDYLCDIRLSTTAGVVASLGRTPLELSLSESLITGNESYPPAPQNNIGTAVILSGQSSVTVSYPGMTSTGIVFASFLGNPISTISAVAGTNNFTIELGGPVDVNTNVAWDVKTI